MHKTKVSHYLSAVSPYFCEEVEWEFVGIEFLLLFLIKGKKALVSITNYKKCL